MHGRDRGSLKRAVWRDPSWRYGGVASDTVDDLNPALPGVMVCSLLWVVQDLYHQPYLWVATDKGFVQLARRQTN